MGCKPLVIVLSNDCPNIKKCSLDRWNIFTIRDGSIEHIFGDEPERNKYAKALELVNEAQASGTINVMTETFNVALKVWPIELFPIGKQYIGLIHELFNSYKYPSITFSSRGLTLEERLQQRVNVKTCSELRCEIFKIVRPQDIASFREISYRSIFPSERLSGMVWNVNITGRDMTPEERKDYDINKQRIKDRKNIYHDKQQEIFAEKFKNKLYNNTNLNNRFIGNKLSNKSYNVSGVLV